MCKIIPLIFTTLILFLPSCSKGRDESPAQSIFARHEKRQLKQHQMKLVAAGVPSGTQDSRIALHYIAFRKMKIPQVRELIVTSINDFLAMANADEHFSAQLENGPLTFRDINFNIGFGNNDGRFQPPPYIGYAYLVDGRIYYIYHDEMFGEFTEEEDVVESFEEALQKLSKNAPLE